MDSNQETFILKEFIVGLIVIVIFLLLFLTGLRKLTQISLYKNLFNRTKQVVKGKPDYCASYPFYLVPKDTKFEFTRVLKQFGWQDKNYKFTLSYPTTSQNKIMYEISSEGSQVPQETVELTCGSDGITSLEADKLLVSALLNIYPESLSDFSYKITNKEGFAIGKGDLVNGQNWESKFEVKGALKENCFMLSAKGQSTFIGKENDIYKIESVWEATPAAFMASSKNKEECYQYQGEFDNKAFLQVQEQNWYATPSGLIKRRISQQTISGQAYFLPNGYQTFEVIDEVVSK